MRNLEHHTLNVLTVNEKLTARLVEAYRQGVKPSDHDIAAFMAIPAIQFLRREHTDQQIVSALANVLEIMMKRQEADTDASQS